MVLRKHLYLPVLKNRRLTRCPGHLNFSEQAAQNSRRSVCCRVSPKLQVLPGLFQRPRFFWKYRSAKVHIHRLLREDCPCISYKNPVLPCQRLLFRRGISLFLICPLLAFSRDLPLKEVLYVLSTSHIFLRAG